MKMLRAKALTGIWCLAETRPNTFGNGIPPSRAKDQMHRHAACEHAKPHTRPLTKTAISSTMLRGQKGEARTDEEESKGRTS